MLSVIICCYSSAYKHVRSGVWVRWPDLITIEMRLLQYSLKSG